MTKGVPNKRYTAEFKRRVVEAAIEDKIAPNLLNRDFHADKLNQKWVTDVTEFSLFGERLYLSPILDLCSSDLVSCTISERPMLSMVIAMLDIPEDTRWNNRRIKAKLKGLLPAIHRQQALSVA